MAADGGGGEHAGAGKVAPEKSNDATASAPGHGHGHGDDDEQGHTTREHRQQFSTGLCDCCDDRAGCCYACCCAPCLMMEMRALREGRDFSVAEKRWGIGVALASGASQLVLTCMDRADARAVYDLGSWTWSDALLACCCGPCSTCQTAREHYARFPDHPRPGYDGCCACGACAIQYNLPVPPVDASGCAESSHGASGRRGKSSRRERSAPRASFNYPMDIPDEGNGTAGAKATARSTALVLFTIYIVVAGILLVQIVVGSGSNQGDLTSFAGMAMLALLLRHALADNETRKVEVYYWIHVLTTIGWIVRLLTTVVVFFSQGEKGAHLVQLLAFAIVVAAASLQWFALSRYRQGTMAAGFWFVPPIQIGDEEAPSPGATRSAATASSSHDSYDDYGLYSY
ncbi:uncharacterized protein AMSG_10680 [Thecamonas trahens ATCC 50062]|uniref:Uncharacterized protein n=1 Tax=Thecamonas trahens ATCC 50062 TaxID=461836 RepID=A0A0L0DUG1_THETB|nr:hypothetical protein AMSG_10680 [Thecamonas trahens ATCC 50062]KNC55083.1 hypothetical protein AMSG_10680 [Thecamonas trahens ATCC 50062]|eukprot:XP_013753267.1 hypothetical protein AMSG_10680 [Thecamonas trahens ATCC 50062]